MAERNADTTSSATTTTKPPRRAGRTVYIGLRRFDLVKHKPVACRGLAIRAFDFSPEQVHRIILTALRDYAEKARLRRIAKEADSQ